jgi:heme-degrading monooxygenase HmoA
MVIMGPEGQTVSVRGQAGNRREATMITILFRSRFKSDVEEEYGELLREIEPLGVGMAGFVSKKTFVAEDRERLSLIEWRDRESLDAWRQHPEHRRAKALGRERYYQSHSLQIFESEAG